LSSVCSPASLMMAATDFRVIKPRSVMETFPSIVGSVACQLPQPNSFARVIAGENEIFTLVQCGGLAVAASERNVNDARRHNATN
jgi:hypothetical protein